MMRYSQVTIFILLFINQISIAQELVIIDFGSNQENLASHNYINNISTSFQSGYSNGVLLFNQQGTATGINLQVHDAWMNINTTGTTAPDHTLGFTRNSSRDSFFGATGVFNGNTEVTGGFKLRFLDANKYYSLSLFASRMNVTDNRETTYTITGNTTQIATLNPSNNTLQTADVFNVQPDINGEITITATAGANNTNSSGFYYLNAVKLEVSNTPIAQFSSQNELQWTYPRSTAIWETGKTVELIWNSKGIDNVTLSYSTDGGATFSNIATVPATDSSFEFSVPNQITSNAVIRISDGIHLIDSNPIEIIPDDGTVYRIVVLGSSTAAGSGPSHRYNAWVWKYRRFLEQLDTRFEVVSVAQGGFVTYNILPTGTAIPAGINRTIDTNKNITQAVNLGAHGVIINLPSNDAASSYPVTDQLHNYALISQTASQNHIPLWVTTPQPRNFALNSTQASIQNQMVTETHNTFGLNAVDFWTGLGNSTGNQILTAYNSGDGVHATNEAHQIFYERLLLKNIHGLVKNTVDNSLSIAQESIPQIRLYPNPVVDQLFIESDEQLNSISIYNHLGQLILEKNNHFNNINLTHFKTGFYMLHVKVENRVYHYRLIKK